MGFFRNDDPPHPRVQRIPREDHPELDTSTNAADPVFRHLLAHVRHARYMTQNGYPEEGAEDERERWADLCRYLATSEFKDVWLVSSEDSKRRRRV